MTALALGPEEVRAVLGSFLRRARDLTPAQAAALHPEAPLDLDSLERLALAEEASAFFRLHESGVEDALLRARTLAGWAGVVLLGWAHGSRSLAFRTSGSSGEPAGCVQPWGRLEREALALAALVGDRRRVVATVPAHHIYGFLWTVLLPRALGVPAVDAAALRPGDLVVGFPLLWERVAGLEAGVPEDVDGVTSTGPCPPELAARLRAGTLGRLLEVYGSTETGGVGWREDDGPYRLLEGWSWDGEGDVLVREGERVRSPDRIVHEADGAFRVLGRRDGAVQVAGVNVHPASVAEAIRAHPLVAVCAVRLMRPHEGTRLKAFVVLARPGAEGEEEVAAFVRSRLRGPERPGVLRFGVRLPTGELGKAADWG